jgi:hypothetical protein
VGVRGELFDEGRAHRPRGRVAAPQTQLALVAEGAADGGEIRRVPL